MKNRGFTFIETLVYLALFSIMIGGIVIAANSLFESSDRNQTKVMMQEEANYLLGKVNWALSGVASIDLPTANSSGSTLNLTKYDGTHIVISRYAGNLIFNGAVLNNSNVTIGNLVFIHTYAGGASPDSAEAGFTINSKMPNGMTISLIASTTRYLRK